MRRTGFLHVMAFCACKNHDAVEQSAPPPTTTPEAIASSAPTSSAELDAETQVGDAGTGDGISVGTIGTLGRDASLGTTRSPRIRQDAVQVNGRLPSEVIQRIVRENFGRIQLCYTNGLRSNPRLQGRVTVKYVIGRDGSVSGKPQDGGSDLPDASVVDCIVRAFQNISYTEPESGLVVVVYPMIFSPPS